MPAQGLSSPKLAWLPLTRCDTSLPWFRSRCSTRGPLSPPSGAISSRKWPYLSLSDLTPTAQGLSSPELAMATSHALQHLPVLDSAQVLPRQPPFLPASEAILSQNGPSLNLSDITLAAQGPLSPQLARPISDAVRHLPALDSAKVSCTWAPFLPASGAISSQKGLKLSLSDLTPPVWGPTSPLETLTQTHAIWSKGGDPLALTLTLSCLRACHPRLAPATSRQLRLVPPLNLVLVLRGRAPFLPPSGPISSQKGSKLTLSDLSGTAQMPSHQKLAQATSCALRHLPAF